MALALLRSCSWEDPLLLPSVGDDDDALVFEASGDDAFGLLGGGSVTAVVPTASALALVELKRAAAQLLPLQSGLSLLGFAHFGRRIWFYHYVRPHLSDAARAFWDAHEPDIRAGLCDRGRVEAEMRLLRRSFPLVIGATAPGRLAEASTLDAHRERLADGWGRRWAVVLALAARRIATAAGAPAANAAVHLKVVLAGAPLRDNPYTSWLILGRPTEPPQRWLSPSGWGTCKAGLPRLEAMVGERGRILAAPGRRRSLIVLGRTPLDPEERPCLEAALRIGGRAIGWGPAPHGAVPLQHDRGLFPGGPWQYTR